MTRSTYLILTCLVTMLLPTSPTAKDLSGNIDPRIQTCKIPNEIISPRIDRNWQNQVNRRAPVDFYILALSWSPAYCSRLRSNRRAYRSPIQCKAENHFGFIVHGLWPSNSRARSSKDHPRYCRRPDKPLNEALIRRHLCSIPDVSLMQRQWDAHGSCGRWKTAEGYFKSIEHLLFNLTKGRPLPDLEALLGRSNRLTERIIKQAFIRLNAELRANMIVLKQRNAVLTEVRICYDRLWKFTPCPARLQTNTGSVKRRANQGIRIIRRARS